MDDKNLTQDDVEQSRPSLGEPAADDAAEYAVSGAAPDAGAPGEAAGRSEEFRTPFEQVIDTARDQTTAAADALRRGEFMQDESVDPGASSDDRLIALLAYASQIFVPVIMPGIILLSESSKKRPFQRFHAVQALALSVFFMAAGFAVMLSTVVAQIVPFLGGAYAFAVACLSPIAMLMYVIALLYYGYQAYQGKRFAIPGLTSFLRDQGWLA
jgi:uncharacterized membrane protein